MLTFLPMDEVDRLSSLEDQEINKAKEVLAFEVTKLVHGQEEAQKAQEGAKAAFGGGGDLSQVPTTIIPAAEFAGEGMGVVSLIHRLGLVPSKGEGFRTIDQGGLTIGGKKISDGKLMINETWFEEGQVLIQKGKKTFHLLQIR
jgi:tyrosyl-tRNA synthetase